MDLGASLSSGPYVPIDSRTNTYHNRGTAKRPLNLNTPTARPAHVASGLNH